MSKKSKKELTEQQKNREIYKIHKRCLVCKETDEFSCVGCLKVRKDYKKD